MKTRRVPFDITKIGTGVKVITRCGYPVIVMIGSDKTYPIRAIVKTEEGSFTYSFTVAGKFWVSEDESDLDLFIEEEVEEDDSDYNPYKEVVKSIADMDERCSELQSIEEFIRIQCRNLLEKCKEQEEQETKVKPKFHKNDWIVQDNVGIFKITEICESWYEVIDSDESNYSISFDQESMCHLWTIQDAKPGDILATKNGYNILIFKNIKSSSGSGFSSYYNYNNFSDYSDFKEGSWDRDRFIPATKEQCDLLSQKMKEAGYEWNSVKKELKKIGEVKERFMTYEEVAMWLTEKPYRQYKIDGNTWIYTYFGYYEEDGNEVADNLLIRENGGDWHRPLVEE